MKIYYEFNNGLADPVPDGYGNDISGLTEAPQGYTIHSFYEDGFIHKYKDDGQGGLEARTAQEIQDDKDRKPITAQQFFSKVFDEYGGTGDWTDVKNALTPVLNRAIEMRSTNGYIVAKGEIDDSSLSQDIKDTIKGFMPKTD